MSLQDAKSITSADVKFPSTAYFAGEKLHGWSVVIDVFHGVAHDVATRVRDFVIAVVPHLHSVQCNLAETPGVGMDMVCRVLYEAQQEHFRWANEVANGVAAAAPVNFSEILGKVQTYRVSSLCPLPSLWHYQTICQAAQESIIKLSFKQTCQMKNLKMRRTSEWPDFF